MVIKLLHEPSIVRYLDTAAQVVTARHVLLMTDKLDCRRLISSFSFDKLILSFVNSVITCIIRFIVENENKQLTVLLGIE